MDSRDLKAANGKSDSIDDNSGKPSNKSPPPVIREPQRSDEQAEAQEKKQKRLGGKIIQMLRMRQKLPVAAGLDKPQEVQAQLRSER